MIINYDIEKINKSLQDFYNATGINMALLKSDFSYACENRRHWEKNRYCKAIQNTKEGMKTCLESDAGLLEKCRETKTAQTHVCPAGLVDVAIPILYNDEIIGYILFGQMKPDEPFEGIENYAAKLGLDGTEMKGYYGEIQSFDSERIESVSNIASMFVKYILLESLLKTGDDKVQRVVSYIEEALDNELSVRRIEKAVNLSKSVLYRMFHDNFGCTVSEYINKRRVEKSLPLLTGTDLPIEEISRRVGFSGASYFGRIFKEIKGVTPLKYRKRMS